jgi:hypothetical protein
LSSKINEIAYPSLASQTAVRMDLPRNPRAKAEDREHYGMKIGENGVPESINTDGERKGDQVSPVK